MLVIPSIDLQQGQCVRLKQGNFNQVSIYANSPVNLAAQYADKGAKRLHIVDLDGAKKGSLEQLALIGDLTSCGIPIQAGGGIRNISHAKALFSAGVKHIVIGSMAITSPETVLKFIDELGAERIILAIDVNIKDGIPTPAIHGWQTVVSNSLWEVVGFYKKQNINTILCTDIAMDGMLNGPNFSLYEEALMRFPTVNWQASGGIRDIRDLQGLSQLGLGAAIIGRALYESDIELSEWFKSC